MRSNTTTKKSHGILLLPFFLFATPFYSFNIVMPPRLKPQQQRYQQRRKRQPSNDSRTAIEGARSHTSCSLSLSHDTNRRHIITHAAATCPPASSISHTLAYLRAGSNPESTTYFMERNHHQRWSGPITCVLSALQHRHTARHFHL